MSKRECMNVKVDAELVRKAKVVAAARHMTLSDYISRLLRGVINDDLGKVAAGLAKDHAPTAALMASGSEESGGRAQATMIER